MAVIVFQYEKAKDFLEALGREHLSRPGKGPTLAKWASWLGYGSKRTVGMVLDGSRLPSRGLMRTLSRKLSLSPEEDRYLELLVLREKQQRNGQATTVITEELAQLRPRERECVELPIEQLRLLSQWFLFPIKQLVESPSFRPEIDWMRQKLKNKISPFDLQKTLDVLLKLKIIEEVNEKRRYRVNRRNLTTPTDISSRALKQAHQQMLHRAAEALTEESLENREFFNLTLRFPRHRMPEVKKHLKQIAFEFDKKFEDTSSDTIYQFSYQVFPHTTPSDSEAK